MLTNLTTLSNQPKTIVSAIPLIPGRNLWLLGVNNPDANYTNATDNQYPDIFASFINQPSDIIDEVDPYITTAQAQNAQFWHMTNNLGAINLKNIANGSMDAYITRTAQKLANYGRPVMWRLFHEFNGTWYKHSPYYGGSYNPDNDYPQFILAWRRVVTIVAKWAPNVRFVWCPNLGSVYGATYPNNNPDLFYPGDQYVNYISTDIYVDTVAGYGYIRDGGVTNDRGFFYWCDFAALHNKPFIISEYGFNNTLSGDDVSWITQGIADLATKPAMCGLIHFNIGQYTIGQYPRTAEYYRKLITSRSQYQINDLPTVSWAANPATGPNGLETYNDLGVTYNMITDKYDLVVVTNVAVSTLFIQPAAAARQRKIVIRNNTGTAITVKAVSGTINGAASYTINGFNTREVKPYNGTDWINTSL